MRLNQELLIRAAFNKYNELDFVQTFDALKYEDILGPFNQLQIKLRAKVLRIFLRAVKEGHIL